MLPRRCVICPAIAEPGSSRCKKHGKGAWTGTRNKGRYGAEWQRIRLKVLKEEPTCRLCGQPSTDVDHIVAVADGGTERRDNLRGLCNPCHKRHTQVQNRARKERKKANLSNLSHPSS